MGLGGTLLAAKCRSEIDYGDAGSAKLHMLVGIVGDIGDSSEVLTDELAQDAVALAMEDAHALHTHEDGIVDEVLHGIERFVATHASHVEVLVEVLAVTVDGLLGEVGYVVAAQVLHTFVGMGLGGFGGGGALWGVGTLQSVNPHTSAHVAKDDAGHLAVDALDGAHRRCSLDAHAVAGCQWLLAGLGLLPGLLLALLLLLLFVGALLLALLASLLALLNLCHLAGYHLVVGLGVEVAYLLLELLQFLADALGVFAFSLALAYLAYGVFDTSVALAQYFFSLLLGSAQYLLALYANLLDIMLIAFYLALQLLLALMDIGALVFPVTLVANDILQILVALDVVGAHDVAGLAYHLFWESYLARNLDGKRAAGATYGELEQRLHLVAVVEHGAVGHALVLVGEVLEVLVVRGDDAPGSVGKKFPQYTLGYGSADVGLGSGAKLVDEYQCGWIGLLQHVLHIEQVGGVGGQVVLETLLIADVYHDVLEHTHARAFVYGDAQTTLHHILQESGGLEADGLSAGIGARDDEYAVVGGELYIKRYERGGSGRVLLEALLEQGVAGSGPVDDRGGSHLRFGALHTLGERSLGVYEVDVGQKVLGEQYLLGMGAYVVGHLLEYADNLMSLVALELAYMVVGLYHLGRLHIHGASACRLVVYDTTYLALQSGRHGQYQSSVA